MNCRLSILVLAIPFFVPISVGSAQNRIGTGKAQDLYKQHCQVCHGAKGEGGLGGDLIDKEWKYGSSDEEIAAVIRKGLPDMGMVAYEELLSEKEIRSLVIYIRELEQIANARPPSDDPKNEVHTTALHDFRLETAFQLNGRIWGLDFLPGGGYIATVKSGELWIIQPDGKKIEITGIPEVWERGQGGLLDVALHPDYEKNGWVYLSFSTSEDGTHGITRFVRGKIKDGTWSAEEVLFDPDPRSFRAGVHFGSRFVFDDGYVFFTVGDRGSQNGAQSLETANGKVFRLHDDGRVPEDNPFVDQDGALGAIWSYGHRNQQGLARHPVSGDLWATEHGPRGGDEVNRVQKGLNYGWPTITHGMNYDGSPIVDKTAQEGMEQPALHWTPSIAVCGIAFYEGDTFPKWQNDLFVTGLASEQLHRLRIRDGQVVEDEIVLKGAGRLRDVGCGPDGELLIVTDRQGVVYRLVPTRGKE